MNAQRRLSRGLPFFLLSMSLGCGVARASAPAVSDSFGSYPAPSAEETARVKAAFRDAAARTVGERSGDLFVLPAKYSYVTDGGHRTPTLAHYKGQPMQNGGTVHGNSWEYDTRIPIVLWGPGFVRPGVQTDASATQQDLTPTYAHLMGTVPPEDAYGRVLDEALVPTSRRPKVILTLVFDQGGEVYYRAHPGATPRIDALKKEGTYFTSAKVSHVDVETGIGHSAIGTGAWPSRTGISSNNFWIRAFGSPRYSFAGDVDNSPLFLGSPTLGDVWLRASENQALVAGYCYADRAAIGMAGHGSLYAGNKKPWVIFYDEKAGKLTTNRQYYALPGYLEGASPKAHLDALTGGTGRWMDHPIDPKSKVRVTPAFAAFDGDNVVKLIEQEPWGADDITDLMYVTLKSTDAAGHSYGHESDEAGAVLAEQDKQLGRIIDALVAKVGRENLVVALTADHGSTPLAELSKGVALDDAKLVADLNRQLDKRSNGVNVFEYASATQLFINEAERVRNGLSYDQLKRAVLAYKVDGKPFFVDAVTRPEATERASRLAKP
ncbi:MAG TPA: alkaline phosphatase family protein [Pantanalinema sp.]